MQIITGKFKGYKIVTSNKCHYRPTTGRVKESIFSILSSGTFIQNGKSILEDAITMDLFAGTGALSFEAISRGAKHSVLIEKDPGHLQILKYNIDKLGINGQVNLVKGDATNLPVAKIKCNLIFIDPPFNMQLVNPTLDSLEKKGWLMNGAIIVIETHYKDKYSPNHNFIELDSRDYGHIILKIYKFLQNDN
jgi:16S rRNA (guanine966-N2)-methyltransferase